MPRVRPLPLARAILIACALGCATASKADVVPWLYDVEVAVPDQSTRARLRGASDALLKLLTRITGLEHVPRSDAVRAALEVPDRYFSSFEFVRDGDGELQLRVSFVPRVVLDLCDAANLPVWSANRPRIMAWIAIDERGQGAGRRVVAADDAGVLAAALAERARTRGLDVRLPIMDLDDQLNVDAVAIWGGMSAVLEPASVRYGADLILTGRVVREADDRVRATWDYWWNDRTGTVPTAEGSAAELAFDVVDFIADELASRFAVLGREPRRLQLAVSGIDDVADYAGVLGYLNRLEYVQDLQVVRVRGTELELAFTSRSTNSQIEELFGIDGRLRSTDADAGTLSFAPADRLRYQWR